MTKLIQGDCREEMDKLIAEGVKVDLTVTSPPYDKLRTYKDTLEWNEKIWKQVIDRLFLITKDGGGAVVWVVGDAVVKGSETGTSFKQALYFKEVGFNLHDTMIYEKNSSSFPAKKTSNRYTQIFEYMFVFSKGKIQANLIADKANKWAGHKDFSGKLKNPVPKFSPRNNIWKYSTSFNDKTNHPAVFPEQLAEDHILSWSNVGDTVFNPFTGSGTTGKMSLLNKRNFIGIEKVPEYFKISQKRIGELNEKS